MELRKRYLPARDPIRVLECFGGHGRIWAAIKRECAGRRLEVTSIDVRRLPGRASQLVGRAAEYLPSLDFSRFDVVDLDAYGIPYEELCQIFGRFQGSVFLTLVIVGMGRLPNALLVELGYTEAMIRKGPVICCRRGQEKVLMWLANRGVKELNAYISGHMLYCHFEL